MPAAIGDNIRSRQERLNASMQEAVETVGQALVAKGAAIIAAQREMEAELRKGLREGFEKEALFGALAALRSGAEQEATCFTRSLALIEGDQVAAPAIEPQLREAKRFLAWLRELEARVSAPAPPFDSSKLPPDPAAPTAEGYVSVSEARARVGRKS